MVRQGSGGTITGSDPAFCSRIARNTGVSSMRRRASSPSGPISAPSRNGTRHPQLPIAAGPSAVLNAAATAVPVSWPRKMLPVWQLPSRPRRCAGAHSARKEAELPHSPPAEKPCSALASTSSAGAARPMVA